MIAENKWTSDQIQQRNINQTMGNHTAIHAELKNHNNTTRSNYALFADDASIDINDITHLEQLLGVYSDSTVGYPPITMGKRNDNRKTKLLKNPKTIFKLPLTHTTKCNV